MLEDLLKSGALCRRLRKGIAGPQLDAFVEALGAQGYPDTFVRRKCLHLAVFTDWMHVQDHQEVTAGLDAYRGYLAAQGRLRGHRGALHGSVAAALLYLRFLRQEELILKMPTLPAPHEVWQVLADYHAWGRQHRGLTERTLRLYEDVLAILLTTLGDDPAGYTAQGLRDFVIDQARPHSLRRGGTIACAVSSFLWFLVAMGRCREGLVHAVPRFASWKLSSVPRYLEAEEVARVIEGCRATDPGGRRDRAILLLMSRLGLRAGDVRDLSFGDIDWHNARISVSGKSRRREWLPLPQEVGDALLDYLENGRVAGPGTRLFLTAKAPYGPLSSGLVSSIAKYALRRAGVASPNHGAHVFRHSAATAMLRQGATLANIGAVLRHRSANTTLQYAKVDFTALSEVALPWPEVTPC